MTESNDMPKRIWAWPHTKYDGDGSYIENYVEGKHPEDAVEYIRHAVGADVNEAAQDLVRVVRELDYVDHPEDEASLYHEFRRVLREAWEGGGQAKNDEHSADKAEGTSVTFSPDSTAAKGTSSQAAAPVTPGPHKPTCDYWYSSNYIPSCGTCGRPADDPIHEVKDDNDRLGDSGAAVPGGAEADVLDSGQDTPVTVGPGDEVRDEEERGADVLKPDMDNRGIFRGDAGGRAVDSSADKAVDAVTVGPGDEVRWADEIHRVVGPSLLNPTSIVIKSVNSGHTRTLSHHLVRTPDGRPVSGFREPDDAFWKAQYYTSMGWFADARDRIDKLEREIEGYKMGADAEAERSDEEYRLRLEAERELEIERSEHHDTADKARAEADALRSELEEARHERGDWQDLYSDAVARCEQLKRERDEARAERDEAQRDLEAFVEPEGDDPWVRLDDETIEKVAWVMFALDNAGPHHRYLHDKLRHCLRELRDGELGGGE